MDLTPRTEQWERWLTYVPFAALAVATVIALVSGPATGATSPPSRLAAQLALVAASAGWLWWCSLRQPERRDDVRWLRLAYVVRTALALALTLLNPLFCIYAWVGYNDAHETFRRTGRWVAIGVTALIMAIGQSGGLPLEWSGWTVLFGALFVVNLGLGGVFSHYGHSIWESNQQRAAVIAELEEVNADLERTMAENARLHSTVVAQAREAGVQQERQRLAQEIHDTIAQSLAGVLAQLQAADGERDLEAVRRRVARASSLAREALGEARRSVMDLAPEPLSVGTLADAVTDLVRSWGQERGVRADVVVAGEPRPLHREVEATVLRIAQEALANVAKHAGATRVGVTLTYDDDEVVLDVRDDGRGFDDAAPRPATSFGLRGMRQRADRLAGELAIETEPGGGTAVSVRLPALERTAA